MKLKLFLLILLGSLTLHTTSQASTVLAYRGCGGGFGDVAACFVGAFLGTTIAQGIEQNRVNRVIRYDTANQLYIQDMIRDYNPAYHNQYVNCILTSCLPYSQKMSVINILNERYAAWIGGQTPAYYPTQVNYHYHIQ